VCLRVRVRRVCVCVFARARDMCVCVRTCGNLLIVNIEILADIFDPKLSIF